MKNLHIEDRRNPVADEVRMEYHIGDHIRERLQHTGADEEGHGLGTLPPSRGTQPLKISTKAKSTRSPMLALHKVTLQNPQTRTQNLHKTQKNQSRKIGVVSLPTSLLSRIGCTLLLLQILIGYTEETVIKESGIRLGEKHP